MNQPEETENESGAKEPQPNSSHDTSKQLEVLSDNGDVFCECAEPELRPCSRDIVSEEEFQDAETRPDSRTSALAGPSQDASSLTECAECLEESKMRMTSEEPKVVSFQSFESSKEMKNLFGPSESSDPSPAIKRFKADRSRTTTSMRFPSLAMTKVHSSGRGDCRSSLADRIRSMSRIPVALVAEKKTHDAKVIAPSPNNADGTCIAEDVKTLSSDEKDGSTIVKPSTTSVHFAQEIRGDYKETPEEAPEIVVTTLAEERLQNQRAERQCEKSGQIAGSRAKRQLETPGSKGKLSCRLSKLMRSKDAVLKTPVSAGRRSANSDLPAERLEAIRQEKAHIRQRMSDSKPVTPRKGLTTPTVKQPLLVTSLKKEINTRRQAIERLGKEGGMSRGLSVEATNAGDAEIDVCPSKVKIETEAAQAGQTNKNEQPPQMKQRTKPLDRPSGPRTPKTGGEPSRADADRKAELVSLSAKYQGRLKKFEGQKGELARTQTELGKTVTSLNQLRDRMLSLSGQDPGLVQVPQLMSESRTAVHATSSLGKDLLAESTTAVTGTNTLPFEEKSGILSQLEAQNVELSKTADSLRKENETLRMIEKDRTKRELSLRKEASQAQMSAKDWERRYKELEQKLADREAALAQLRGGLAKQQDLGDRLKQKESQITSLRKQFAEESNEHKIQLKKATEAKEALQQDLLKEQEKSVCQLKKMKEENGCLQLLLEDERKMKLRWEDKHGELEERHEEEKKKRNALESELISRGKEISDLERKLEEMENSSSNVLGLSEQLMQKDSIISELEEHRASIQSQNREMCSILSSTFELLGQEMREEEVESLLTGGRAKTLKNKLTQLMSGKANVADKQQDKASAKKMLELENKVAVLQAELQESKNYGETLARVISDNSPWNSPDEVNEMAAGVRRVDPSGGDHRARESTCLTPLHPPTLLSLPTRNGPINEMRELFARLEGKKQALMRMEKKMQELEEIHANCAQKRVRNEIRIDQLEMMLASYKE